MKKAIHERTTVEIRTQIAAFCSMSVIAALADAYISEAAVQPLAEAFSPATGLFGAGLDGTLPASFDGLLPDSSAEVHTRALTSCFSGQK